VARRTWTPYVVVGVLPGAETVVLFDAGVRGGGVGRGVVAASPGAVRLATGGLAAGGGVGRMRRWMPCR